ncbi:hypothetical protein [Nonomuraea sp. NPDC003214]
MRRSSGIVALALAAGLLTGAQPAAAGVQAACSLSPGTPYKDGYKVIAGVVTWAGSSCGRMTMKLQRSRWYGWQDMVDDSWDSATSSSKRASLRVSCDGTHEWRIWFDSSNTSSRTGLTRKISCP